MKNTITCLHIIHASNNKANGIRSIVPQYLEHQKNIVNVALLNCNDTEIEEAKGKFCVYKLNELEEKKINNLPEPFNNPDIVIFHAIYYPQYIKLYKQCIKRDIPYVIVPHGSLTRNAQRQKFIKKIPANILLFNAFINHATSIQFLSEGEKQRSRRVKKYIIKGNGIEIVKEGKIFNNKENEKFKVVYIGRYDMHIKGLDLLIKAVKLIKNYMRENNIVLYLYGKDFRGMEKKIRKQVKQYQLNDLIYINGPVWKQEKINILKKSDVFIQTSRTEGQPVGLMEAIAIGLPCIVTDGTNFGNIVEQNRIGWKTKTCPRDISEKIIEAFKSKLELQQMSERAKKYAQENFEWNQITQNTINEYKKIIVEYKKIEINEE